MGHLPVGDVPAIPPRATEVLTTLQIHGGFSQVVVTDGRALAHLKQDDAAKAQFERFAKMGPEENLDRQRALRFLSKPELARARMAPAFAITTIDGQRVSLDEKSRRSSTTSRSSC